MTAAVKYRLKADTSKYEKEVRVDILQEDYTGDIQNKSIGGGYIDLLKTDGVIQYTSLVVSIQADSNFEYLEFFQYNTLKNPVKLYIGDVLEGTFFIVPESYSEPYINPPYDVQIIATDGLGLLENYTFDNDGMQTCLEAIIYCLNKLGLDIGFSISVDLFETNMQSSAAMFAQRYFNGAIFNGETCNSVLTQLLPFGVKITQAGNRWLIRRPFEDIEKTHLEYTSAGVYVGTLSGETVQTLGIYGESDVWPRGSSPLLALQHAWREVKVTEQLGSTQSIIFNSDFSDASYGTGVPGSIVGATFNGWSTGPITYGIVQDGVNYLCLHSMDDADPVNFDPATYVDSTDATHNTVATTLEANTAQQLNLKFTYGGIHYDDAWTFGAGGVVKYPDLYIVIKCGSYYLNGVGAWLTEKTFIALGGVEARYRNSTINFTEFDITALEVKAGNLELYVYRPIFNETETILPAYVAIGNIHATVLNNINENYSSVEETVLGVREESTHSGDDIALKPVDLPDITNNVLIYPHGSYYKSGAYYIPTLNWSNNGQTAVPYLNVLQAQLINYYGDPKQTLSGTKWRGQNLHLNSVVKHALNYNRVFIADYGTWHILDDEFTISWREKWLEFPYQANAVVYFDRRVGNQLIDRLNGSRATVDATGVTFPEITGTDIFNKTNTTYWAATIPNTAGDNRKWLFAELDWEFMVDYATDDAHGTLFLKDFGSDVRSTLPIMVFSPARSEAQQSEIVDYLSLYSFIVDESGNIVVDEDGSTYLVDGTI